MQKVDPKVIKNAQLNRLLYTQGLCYNAFEVNLDRCFGSCNTHNDLSNKACVPNKTRFKTNRVQHDYRNE